MPGVTGPPPDFDLLRIRRVARDEATGRWFHRLAREEADGQIERAPPGVHWARPSPVRGPQRAQHKRGAGGRREVRRHVRGVIGGVFVVLVQWCGPRRLLWLWVDADRAH